MRFILLVTRFAVFSRPALAQDKVEGVQNHPHVALPHRTTYNHEQMNPSISLAIDLTPSVRSELRWELAGVDGGRQIDCQGDRRIHLLMVIRRSVRQGNVRMVLNAFDLVLRQGGTGENCKPGDQ